MKIVLFDMEHYETAFALVSIFDTPENTITIFTNHDCYVKMEYLLGGSAGRYQWRVKSKAQYNAAFIRNMYRSFQTEKPDLLIYGTLTSNHFLHSLLLKRYPPRQSLLTVHAVNMTFNYPLSIGLRHFSRYYGNRGLIKQVTAFNVIAETMLPVIGRELGQKKPVYNLPGTVCEHKDTRVPFQLPLHIVIPGTIDATRRDYDQVFELLAKIKSITITLLGRPSGKYGRQVIERCREFQNIHSYDSTVDQGEFEAQLSSAHFVWVPSVIESRSPEGVVEQYGITKSSGSLFDAIRHARPLIVPVELAISGDMEEAAIRYRRVDDIVIFINKLIADRGWYEKLQENARRNSDNYTVEKIRERNAPLFIRT